MHEMKKMKGIVGLALLLAVLRLSPGCVNNVKDFQSLNKVFLKDSVVVKNILKGDTLRCRELWWDQKTQKFTTNKPVRIYKKGGTVIYGEGLEAPQDFSGYTIMQITGPYGFPENTIPK